jgi:hypothetical protein
MSTTEDAIADAYRRVADGYRHALEVDALPPEEVESLRTCLRACLQIADEPLLTATGSGGAR